MNTFDRPLFSREAAEVATVGDATAASTTAVIEAAETNEDGRSGSPPISNSCPLCRRRDWRQLEGDIWRLDSWLVHAGHQLELLLDQV